MKVLVTGAKGQLGMDIIKILKNNPDYTIFEGDHSNLDITNYENVRIVLTDFNPDWIIHTAAWTNVDAAESEKDQAYFVNVIGTENLVKIAETINTKFIYISTDYVFDGSGDKPYEVNDYPHPINYYGTTKYLGEEVVKNNLSKYFIVRISWVFGLNGNNFVKTMLRLGKEKESLNIVCDQIGSPTYTKDLAYLLSEMIKTDKYGIYHATNEGYCSWYQFAAEIFTLSDIKIKINPIKTSDYKTMALRPLNSRLSKESLLASGFNPLRPWQEALAAFLAELNEVKI